MLSMKEDTSADTHKMTITAKPRSPCKDMKQSLRNFVPVGAFYYRWWWWWEGRGGEGLWGGVHHPSTFISHTRARYLIFPPNFRGWRVYISGESAPQSNTVLGSKCEHSLILSAYTGSFPTDLNSLSPKIHIQILQTDLHTFLFRIVERIWLKIKAFSLS